ncbi:MAG TPA: hydroxyacid dehydrogenase [Mycobacterium sp.]|jgi:phosphoglycerate dehydrogenase-like enzyme|nr:hydroxyacid dehydrogenase [Mycobacterium sp.]
MTNSLTWIPRPVADEAITHLRKHGDVALGYGPNAVDYRTVAPRTTGVLLRTAEFRKDDIDLAPKLRVIARHGAGFDTVDVDAATERGIPVTVTGAANADSVAEHVFALLLAVARNVTAADRAVRDGQWSTARGVLTGIELVGRTMGLLGCGRIGRRVAAIAQALGMTVVASDPALSDVPGVPLVGKGELLEASDVVSLHLPLTPTTANIIDREALAALPTGAILINTARGELIDESALLEYLDNGHLAGAGLDVLATEPPSAANPLVAHPRTVLSPHIGGQTYEAMRRVALDAAHSILAVYRGEVPANAINIPVASQ